VGGAEGEIEDAEIEREDATQRREVEGKLVGGRGRAERSWRESGSVRESEGERATGRRDGERPQCSDNNQTDWQREATIAADACPQPPHPLPLPTRSQPSSDHFGHGPSDVLLVLFGKMHAACSR